MAVDIEKEIVDKGLRDGEGLEFEDMKFDEAPSLREASSAKNTNRPDDSGAGRVKRKGSLRVVVMMGSVLGVLALIGMAGHRHEPSSSVPVSEDKELAGILAQNASPAGARSATTAPKLAPTVVTQAVAPTSQPAVAEQKAQATSLPNATVAGNVAAPAETSVAAPVTDSTSRLSPSAAPQGPAGTASSGVTNTAASAQVTPAAQTTPSGDAKSDELRSLHEQVDQLTIERDDLQRKYQTLASTQHRSVTLHVDSVLKDGIVVRDDKDNTFIAPTGSTLTVAPTGKVSMRNAN